MNISPYGYLQFGSSSSLNSSTPSLAEFEQYARIAPLWNNSNTWYGNGSGIYVDTSTTGQVTIRWSGLNPVDYSYINTSVTLFRTAPSGSTTAMET